MSRLTDLIAQAKAKDPQMGIDLEREFKALSSRLAFGLNFERHRPEVVELPKRPVRKGDKVRVLPERGSTAKGDQRLLSVKKIEKIKGKRIACLGVFGSTETETKNITVDDLVVVAEFRDYIYPGLVSTGKVERGGDKPCHTVINGENYHVLKALTYTHRGKVDVIYIDPPYNTGAKDWKYNNDYVESEDLYRHSKWLAFMERRLKVARELLNPADSVLIVTIDEKEVHRLGLLIEQTFPEAKKTQMVTIVIQAAGSNRKAELGRVEEYAMFVFFGDAAPQAVRDDLLNEAPSTSTDKVRWESLLRSGTDSSRTDTPQLFYPIFIDRRSGRIVGCGESKPVTSARDEWVIPDGTFAIWPLKKNGQEGRWRCSTATLLTLLSQGYVKAGICEESTAKGTIWYLGKAARAKIENGEFKVLGRDSSGALEVTVTEAAEKTFPPKTVWNRARHHAGWHGTNLIGAVLLGRKFPFPKSLYAVEDSLRIAVNNKPSAVVLDFFAGSGTTAHAVMRLNRQDGGRRQCISVTNNEVAADEQMELRKQGLRAGDPDWEQWGICDYITKPRVEAVITGMTPSGEPINGDYKFTDEFPMSEGFEENAEFFTLTYETPVAVSHNFAFERVAPLLWMRAGSRGRRIETLPDRGWDVTDTYGLLIELDQTAVFCTAVEKADGLRVAYIVTNDDRRFQAVVRSLPDSVEPVRLYESYLSNFKFANGE